VLILLELSENQMLDITAGGSACDVVSGVLSGWGFGAALATVITGTATALTGV
jgi:hypothetical protein